MVPYNNLNGVCELSFASLYKFLPAYVTIHDRNNHKTNIQIFLNTYTTFTSTQLSSILDYTLFLTFGEVGLAP